MIIGYLVRPPRMKTNSKLSRKVAIYSLKCLHREPTLSRRCLLGSKFILKPGSCQGYHKFLAMF